MHAPCVPPKRSAASRERLCSSAQVSLWHRWQELPIVTHPSPPQRPEMDQLFIPKQTEKYTGSIFFFFFSFSFYVSCMAAWIQNRAASHASHKQKIRTGFGRERHGLWGRESICTAGVPALQEPPARCVLLLARPCTDAQSRASGALGHAVPQNLCLWWWLRGRVTRPKSGLAFWGKLGGKALILCTSEARRNAGDCDSIGHNECTGSATGRHFLHPSPCSHMVQ